MLLYSSEEVGRGCESADEDEGVDLLAGGLVELLLDEGENLVCEVKLVS